MIAVFGAAPAVAAPSAKPLWQYSLPAGEQAGRVLSTSRTVIAIGSPSTFALARASGRLQWSTKDHASAAAVNENALFFGNERGGIGARRLDDGTLIWRLGAVCPKPPWSQTGRVSIVERFGRNLLAGCSGGDVVRIDARRGTIEARASGFLVDNVQSIVPLGSCAYGVFGISSGAHMETHNEILGCTDLRTILADQEETFILGAVGDTAFLNDVCCNGRGGQAAAVFRVDLRMGVRSADIPLTPEPGRYPPSTREIGEDQNVALIGDSLYLGLGRTLYRYADARSVTERSPARRIADNLAAVPQFLGGNCIVLPLAPGRGDEILRIARVDGDALTKIAAFPAGVTRNLGYDPTNSDLAFSPALNGGAHYVRLTDGRRITIEHCSGAGSDQTLFFAECPTAVLINGAYLQDLRAFAWP